MKSNASRFAIILIALFAASPCLAHHMAVVVSKQSGVAALTSAQVGRIFRTELKKWPDGKNVTVVLHRASLGAQATLRHLNKMSAEQWQAWLTEHKDSVKLVETDSEVLAYVESTPGAVGLVDVRSITDRITVVRVDGKMPLEEGYLPH
jgi:ABC-type phosphate transport system substrate-binding protein